MTPARASRDRTHAVPQGAMDAGAARGSGAPCPRCAATLPAQPSDTHASSPTVPGHHRGVDEG
jgi:hypothetical protein